MDKKLKEGHEDLDKELADQGKTEQAQNAAGGKDNDDSLDLASQDVDQIIDNFKEQIEALQDKLLRAMAENENMRARNSRY